MAKRKASRRKRSKPKLSTRKSSARAASAKNITVVHDGELTQAEALGALGAAAQAATEALPDALAACKTAAERQKVQADRDTVVLAFLNSLKKSLANTSTLFETTASDLEEAAAKVTKQATTLRNATEAINLLTDLVRLAGSLALAFA
jgi:hypothetical protein